MYYNFDIEDFDDNDDEDEEYDNEEEYEDEEVIKLLTKVIKQMCDEISDLNNEVSDLKDETSNNFYRVNNNFSKLLDAIVEEDAGDSYLPPQHTNEIYKKNLDINSLDCEDKRYKDCINDIKKYTIESLQYMDKKQYSMILQILKNYGLYDEK